MCCEEKATTKMINALPLDLFRVVIEQYASLSVVELSCLDVAFCSHTQRVDFWMLMEQVKIHANLLSPVRLSLQVKTCLNWVIARKMRLSYLRLANSFLLGDSNPLAQPLLVDHLDITDRTDLGKDPDIMNPIQELVNVIPSLKLLGCWPMMTDGQLLSLQDTPCQLKGLDLSYCSISSTALLQFFRARGKDLREFKFNDHNRRDAIASFIMLTCCRNLEALSVPGHLLTPDDIMRMNRCLNALKKLSVKGSISIETVGLLLARLPKLGYLRCFLTELAFTQIEVTRNNNGVRCFDIHQSRCSAAEEQSGAQCALLSAIRDPIISLQMMFTNEHSAGLCLQTLHNHGSALEWLSLELNFANNGDCLHQLLKHCPNLTELRLRLPSACTALKQLAYLPLLCPMLRALHIQGCVGHAIAEANIFNMLV